MATVWVVVIGLVLVSWVSARDRGVPWFSLGGTSSKRKALQPMLSVQPVTPFRLRTENIKAKSPWLEPSGDKIKPKQAKPKQAKPKQAKPKQAKPKPPKPPKPQQAKQAKQAKPKQPKPQQIKKDFPTKDFYRLDELTHNAETSRRLVNRLQQKHPDRNLKWCVEKAILDIERDRMAR
jgi:outer membrane biosynthesis protein TonB